MCKYIAETQCSRRRGERHERARPLSAPDTRRQKSPPPPPAPEGVPAYWPRALVFRAHTLRPLLGAAAKSVCPRHVVCHGDAAVSKVSFVHCCLCPAAKTMLLEASKGLSIGFRVSLKIVREENAGRECYDVQARQPL